MENRSIKWAAPEFVSHKKSSVWYICFAVIAIAIIGYGIYTRNLLTIVTFVLIAIIAFVFSHKQPQMIEYGLTGTDVIIGNRRYPYRNIKNFWIIYSAENKSVNFETTAYLNNQLTLLLGKQDPVFVRRFLKDYLPEDLDRQESFTDVLARRLKF